MNILLHSARKLTQLGWRLTNLAQLRFQPHVFFQRVYALPWYADTMRDWFRWLQAPAASRILELGCSSGGFAAELAAYGYAVVAVDRSARALRTARRRHPHSQPEFMTADALQLPFAQKQFDYSLAASLLNVVSDPAALLTEMRRVTATNGIVSCLFPTADLHHGNVKAFIHQNALSGFSATAVDLWARLARKLDTAAVVQMFTDAGLTHIRTSTFLEGMVSGVLGYQQ